MPVTPAALRPSRPGSRMPGAARWPRGSDARLLEWPHISTRALMPAAWFLQPSTPCRSWRGLSSWTTGRGSGRGTSRRPSDRFALQFQLLCSFFHCCPLLPAPPHTMFHPPSLTNTSMRLTRHITRTTSITRQIHGQRGVRAALLPHAWCSPAAGHPQPRIAALPLLPCYAFTVGVKPRLMTEGYTAVGGEQKGEERRTVRAERDVRSGRERGARELAVQRRGGE